MNVMLSTAILTLLVFISLGLVLNIGNPMVSKTRAVATVQEAEQILNYLDNYITEIANEGEGASRTFSFSTMGQNYHVLSDEESIVFKFESSQRVFAHLTRQKKENLLYISGGDVTCNSSGSNLVMENTHLKIYLQKVGSSSSPTAIDTQNNIVNITQKDSNVTVTPTDTRIVLNGDDSTRNGTGYSEIMHSGKNLPMCIAHFYVNTSTTPSHYDVYYILYAGADFLEVKVRNIKN